DVEIVVHQPRGSLRHDVDVDALERVEEPVPAGAEQAAELAVAEVQTDLVRLKLYTSEHHVAPPRRLHFAKRERESVSSRMRCFSKNAVRGQNIPSVPRIPAECASSRRGRREASQGDSRPVRWARPLGTHESLLLASRGGGGIHALHGRGPCCRGGVTRRGRPDESPPPSGLRWTLARPANGLPELVRGTG